MTEPDVVAVRKAVQAHELVPLETTLLTKRPAVGFKDAERRGTSSLGGTSRSRVRDRSGHRPVSCGPGYCRKRVTG